MSNPERLFVSDYLIDKKLDELRCIPAISDWETKKAPWAKNSV
jgi:hypothetical protein